MNGLYLIPSLVSSIFLFSIAVYLLSRKPRKEYVFPLAGICLSSFLWNVGIVLTNLTNGEILWAQISTLGLIIIPAVIFHFAAGYTGYIKAKYYLIGYIPVIFLSILLAMGYYVTDVEYRVIGYEPVYNFFLFAINSWIGLFFIIFSTFLLFRYYKESVGIKKRQSFYILVATPANAFFSFVTYEIMVEIYHIAQFPVGATLDFLTLSLILYAILKFKLPLETAAEIDFRILAETASEGICIIDKSGDIDYANSYFCEMVDSTKKSLLGKPFIQFISPEYQEKFSEYFKKTIHGEKITGMEVKIRKCNGEEFTAEINTSPIIWNEKPIGSFITIRDIEKRKKIEEELRKQKTYFQALFESSPEAIVSLDEKHRILDVNPAFEELFGYTVDEIKGKNLDDFVLPEEEKRIGKQFTLRVMNGEIIKAEGKRKRKDGSLVYVSILGAPIFIEGKQVGIFTIYRDISARKKAEQEKEFYHSLLRHDVANKIAVIQGNLELLEETPLTEEQKALVKGALKAAYSSSDLITNIRKLREAGTQKSLRYMDLHEILSKVIHDFEEEAKKKGIKIEYAPIEGIIKADSLVENVFSNIIQNAIIHSNCKTITISGEEIEKGGKIFYKISIEDDGEGIPPEIKEKIFDPRVKRKGSPGSGLGLYLVKKLVEGYGGYIEVRAANKQGTIFDIYLPKAE